MKVGDFVQLLDLEGEPLKDFYGIVTKTDDSLSGGWAQVYWHSGGYNGAHHSAPLRIGSKAGGSTMWALKRLKVISSANL